MQTKRIELVLRLAVAGEFWARRPRDPGKNVDRVVLSFRDCGSRDGRTAAFLIGLLDVAVALVVLVRRFGRSCSATFWGFWTALVRPIVGEPIWDFIERFANWGAPLALLSSSAGRKIGEWLRDRQSVSVWKPTSQDWTNALAEAWAR